MRFVFAYLCIFVIVYFTFDTPSTTLSTFSSMTISKNNAPPPQPIKFYGAANVQTANVPKHRAANDTKYGAASVLGPQDCRFSVITGTISIG